MSTDNELTEIMNKEPDVSENIEADLQGGGADPGADPGEDPSSKPSKEPSKDLSGLGDDVFRLVDKYGRPFDPKIHVSDEFGKPVVNKTKGFEGFIKIKPGAKKPSTSFIPPDPDLKPGPAPHPEDEKGEAEVKVEPETKPDPEVQKVALSPEIAGQMAARLTFAVGVQVGGHEWQPVKEPEYNEWDLVKGAWSGYFASTGGAELAPSKLLLLTLALYAIPRFTMPETQKRFGWLGRRMKQFFGWLKKVFRRNGTHVDNRHDRKRENNKGEATGGFGYATE